MIANPATIAHCTTREKNGEAKQRAAAGAVAGCLGSRDESDDGVVETEDADLAHEISRRPRDEENAERGRAEQPRDKESEDSAEIRGEQRDGVEEHPALQFRAVIDGARQLRDRRQSAGAGWVSRESSCERRCRGRCARADGCRRSRPSCIS